MAEPGVPGRAPRIGSATTRSAPAIDAVLRSASQAFDSADLASSGLDARLLLAEALGVQPSAIHSHAIGSVSSQAAERFAAFCARRLAGEPVHRIIGRRAFYEHEFRLSPGTLEPRPDTEVLVDVAKAEMARILAVQPTCTLADLGVGSGAIVVSLLALFPPATAIGVDICDDALATTRCNAEDAGVADRLTLVHSDYCTGIAGPFDLVVSNPPYIRSAEIEDLSREVREHDPVAALDGGPDGLDAYHAIAGGVRPVLRPGGAVIVEIGAGQGEDVRAIFAESGYPLEAETRDLSGIIRVLTFRG